MYKSRLHSWGLDKKKKEHEMLDLVRQGLQQQGDDKDKVFIVRGRQVTLADALHYFNRKGIKDPSSLLEGQPEASADLSSPDDLEARTPLSSSADPLDSASTNEADYDLSRSPTVKADPTISTLTLNSRSIDFAYQKMRLLQDILGVSELGPMPAFRTLSVESELPPLTRSAEEYQFLDAIYQQIQSHYKSLFESRNLSVSDATWTTTSDDTAADKFYYSMYHGYSFLWNGQRDKAFDNFYQASSLIEGLLKDNHVGFLVYVFDLIIRHDGTGFEDPLMMILDHLAEMAKTVFKSVSHPIYLIAVWMKETKISRAWLAESILRKLLDFFQDSIGYFHPETIALLQTFATGLMNRERYSEAAIRFQQVVDAFETTLGKRSYEVAYALRSTSEAYFHLDRFTESLQALKAALECSESLSRLEEREIYVRCLRGLAEIFNKIGRHEEAVDSMSHVVDVCKDVYGAEHTFTHRARMHLKSIQKGDVNGHATIPLMVHRLGRGGSAAKYVWVSRSSPTRLAP